MALKIKKERLLAWQDCVGVYDFNDGHYWLDMNYKKNATEPAEIQAIDFVNSFIRNLVIARGGNISC